MLVVVWGRRWWSDARILGLEEKSTARHLGIKARDRKEGCLDVEMGY